MEFSFLFLFLFVPTLYCLFLTFIIIKRKKANGKLDHLPPGSLGWPVIGETLDYLSTLRNGCPEKFIFDRKNKYFSEVFKTSLLGEPMVILCSAKGNKFLFSEENKLVKSWWPKNLDAIFAAKPEKTSAEGVARLRKIISPLLKPRSLRKYVETMDMMTKEHLKTHWDGKDQVKGQALTKKYTLALACRLLLNIEDQETLAKLEESLEHIASGVISLPINLPGTKFNRAIRASKQLKEEIKKFVGKTRIDLLENKVGPMSSIWSDMFKDTNNEGQMMNDDEVAYALGGLLVGASDTVSFVLVSLLKCLAEKSQLYDGVFREQMEISKAKGDGELLNWEDIQKMTYSWNVACEVMRLWPPASGTFREAITDFMHEGFLIPKGFKFHWNAYATHKNPKYFPDPDKFDPSRFEGKGPIPFSYVPFGGGLRMCPGNEYARVKILVFLHNVVKNLKWEKVFPGENIIMDPLLTPEKGLPLRLYPRAPYVNEK